MAVDIFPVWKPRLGVTYARAGRTEEALDILSELEATPTPGAAYAMVRIHAALGNRDEVIRWLGYQPPHAWAAWLPWQKDLQPYRDDPRFQAFLRRMNLRFDPGAAAPTPLPPESPDLPEPVTGG